MIRIPDGPNPCNLIDRPEIDLKRAGVILEPFVEDIRDAYIEFGLTKVNGTRVIVSEEAREGKRHFAACRTDGAKILLAPDLIRLPTATAVGIIAHEFGHAADYLYPAAFEPGFLGGMTFRQYGMRSNDGVPRGIAARWNARDDYAIETAADGIAELVLTKREGRKVIIGYNGPCLLETIGAGVRPRPRGLR